MLGGFFLAGHYFNIVHCRHSYHGGKHDGSLQYQGPIIILIITALFFREKTTVKAVIGVIVALTGAADHCRRRLQLCRKSYLRRHHGIIRKRSFMPFTLWSEGRCGRKSTSPVYVFIVFFNLLGSVPDRNACHRARRFTGYSGWDFFYLFAFAMVCSIGAHAVFNWVPSATFLPLYISTIETGESIFAAVLAAPDIQRNSDALAMGRRRDHHMRTALL